MVLSTIFHANELVDRPFVGILEVRDSDGVTVYLAWGSNIAKPGSDTRMGFSWLPEKPGCYEVRVLALSSIENPALLSEVVKSTVVVASASGENVVKGLFVISEEGKASLRDPRMNDTSKNYAINFIITGEFVYRENCYMELIPNNATLTINADGKINVIYIDKPVVTLYGDNNLSYNAATVGASVLGNINFERPYGTVDFDRGGSLRSSSNYLDAVIDDGTLRVSDGRTYIRFTPVQS